MTCSIRKAVQGDKQRRWKQIPNEAISRNRTEKNIYGLDNYGIGKIQWKS